MNKNLLLAIFGNQNAVSEDKIITYMSSEAVSGEWVTNNTDTSRNSFDEETREGVLYLNEDVTSIGGYFSTGYTPFYNNSNVTEIDLSLSGLISIEYVAFSNCSSLTSITIPDSVTSIGDEAFYRCSSLTSITIPDSVTSIGDNVFRYCSSLTSIKVDSSNTKYDSRSECNAIIETATKKLRYGCKNTIIPSNVTSIDNSAFFGCNGLTSITIPDSVTSIGTAAFYDCSGLTSVTIPNSVTSIGEWAFIYCDSLTSIIIPNSVTSIGRGAFDDCSSLTSVTCLATNPPTLGTNAFQDINTTNCIVPQGYENTYLNSNWFTGNNGPFQTFNGITLSREIHYTTSNNQIVTNNWITNNCESNTYSQEDGGLMILNEGVTSIGDNAFNNCSYLTSVTIPNSVTSIEDNAFNTCSYLTSIIIPNSVTSIGNYAFTYCERLTSIIIPNSVTSIGKSIFWGSTNLTSITVDSNNPIYDSRGNCNAIIETSTNKLIQGCQNTIIPNNITSIGNGSLSFCSFNSITIPNSVTSIEDNAFNTCSYLTSIIIPNSVTSIGAWAFYRCITLTSITIPSSVTSIGNYVFSQCNSLTSITVDDNNPIYDSRDNCNAIIETSTNKLIQGCQNTIIPNNITSIGNAAFNELWYLTSITIPSSVTSIGNYAFYDCSTLTSVICEAITPPSLGSNNFTTSNDTLYVPSESVDSYKANANWKNAFGVDNILPIPTT